MEHASWQTLALPYGFAEGLVDGFCADDATVGMENQNQILAFVLDNLPDFRPDTIGVVVHCDGRLAAEGWEAGTRCGKAVALEEAPYALEVVRIVPGPMDEEDIRLFVNFCAGHGFQSLDFEAAEIME